MKTMGVKVDKFPNKPFPSTLQLTEYCQEGRLDPLSACWYQGAMETVTLHNRYWRF